MAPLSAPLGRVNWTCLLEVKLQLAGSIAVDGESHVIPAGVTHVSRQLKVTCDLSWLAAGYERLSVSDVLVLSNTNSSRLMPVTGEPSPFFATGKLVPIV